MAATSRAETGQARHQKIRPLKSMAAKRGGQKDYDMWLGIIYLSWVETLVNEVLRLVPSVLTATIMARDMPAAIKPYSIAVASD